MDPRAGANLSQLIIKNGRQAFVLSFVPNHAKADLRGTQAEDETGEGQNNAAGDHPDGRDRPGFPGMSSAFRHLPILSTGTRWNGHTSGI